jgi:ubiquinone/menaquinone biosynthesis C-methylase UbiE
MSFSVPAESYDRFMGRYSSHLSGQLADLAGVAAGQRVLDVGCGPGVLTRELVERVGASNVAAVDPSEPFVEAARARLPGVDVRLAAAESLPFADGSFDAALAQLVVHFMREPVAGLREMARVTRVGGAVAACVWDYRGERAPLSAFWAAARISDEFVIDESHLAGAHEGHLEELFREADLADVRGSAVTARSEDPTFEAWWEPYTLGVGPAGAYVATLDEEQREQLRQACLDALGPGPIRIEAVAWACVGRVDRR